MTKTKYAYENLGLKSDTLYKETGKPSVFDVFGVGGEHLDGVRYYFCLRHM